MVSLFFLPKAPAAGSKPSSQDLPGSGVRCKNCGPSPAPAPSSELCLQKDLVRRRWRGSVFEYFGNCRCRRGQGDQRHEIRQDITTDKLLRHPNVVCLHERCRLQNVKHGKLLPLFGSEVFNSSFVSAPAELTAGSFSRSYAEQTMSSAQRGDRSSGSKPWEMQQYSQQRPGYGSNSQLSDDGSYSDAQDSYAPSYHQNGKAPDFHADEPRPLTYNTGVEERPPPQHRWVPPQPPGVVMPEAAAAIRQPKTPPKQPFSNASEAASEMQVNGASSASDAVTEVPVNGATAIDAGHSEIEEQSVAI